MMNRTCRISVLGMVSALGGGHAQIMENLLSETPPKLVQGLELVNNEIPFVGKVTVPLAEFPEQWNEYRCRNNALALTAYLQIEEQVQERINTFGPFRIGVVLGTSTSGIAATEQAVRVCRAEGEFPQAYDYAQHELNSVADFIASYAGITGPAYTISTACSSSGKVFASGQALLEMGLCDAVVVGGADSLCELTLNGFSALELLSDEISNPMSKNRKGLNIGEGAGLFMLEKAEGGIQLLGVGESSDAHHMSAPDPQGRGAVLAIRDALQKAKLTSESIQYVNLHGTGTRLNDEIEARAMQTIFENPPPCSSTKPLTGHCLGASGALEAGICWLTLSKAADYNGRIPLPPHWWDGAADESFPELALTQTGQSIAAQADICIMSSSFAFGGNNVALIMGSDFG